MNIDRAPLLYLFYPGSNTSDQWVNQYNSVDDGDSLGAGYARTLVAHVGGPWGNSSYCGSRCSEFFYSPLYLYVSISAR